MKHILYITDAHKQMAYWMAKSLVVKEEERWAERQNHRHNKRLNTHTELYY